VVVAVAGVNFVSQHGGRAGAAREACTELQSWALQGCVTDADFAKTLLYSARSARGAAALSHREVR